MGENGFLSSTDGSLSRRSEARPGRGAAHATGRGAANLARTLSGQAVEFRDLVAVSLAARARRGIVSCVEVPKQLIVMGDRVLIEPDEDVRTHSGLFLPQGAHESDGVRAGKVIATGPGVPLPSLQQDDDEEPWKETRREDRYLPMQVKVGDHALFFKKAAVEVRYEGTRYLVVPQSAILIVMRASPDASDEVQPPF